MNDRKILNFPLCVLTWNSDYDLNFFQDCETDLHRSLERYNMLNTETEEAGAKIDLFNEVLDDSVFVANKISEGSEDSDNLVTSICLNVRGKSLNNTLEWHTCLD